MKSKLLAGILMLALFVCIVLVGEYMAEATISFSNQKSIPPKQTSPFRVGYVDITLDDSYPAGGWSVTAANLNLTGLLYMVPPAFTLVGDTGAGFSWDATNKKIIAYLTGMTISGALKIYEVYGGDTDIFDGEVIRCFYMGY
jgi:hypothetical protein